MTNFISFELKVNNHVSYHKAFIVNEKTLLKTLLHKRLHTSPILLDRFNSIFILGSKLSKNLEFLDAYYFGSFSTHILQKLFDYILRTLEEDIASTVLNLAVDENTWRENEGLSKLKENEINLLFAQERLYHYRHINLLLILIEPSLEDIELLRSQLENNINCNLQLKIIILKE